MGFFKKLFNSEKPRQLQWPPAIRSIRPEEIPHHPEAFEKIKQLAAADIREGYTLKQNTDNDLPFKFYAEINVDNDRLWDVFTALSVQLPHVVSCLFAHNGVEEPAYGNYLPKHEVLNVLGYYRTELAQDCFMEFGIIFHDDSRLVEVFVPDAKYIKFWGVDEPAFRAIMNEKGLAEEKELKFLDEYPKAVEPLTSIKSDAIPTAQVIAALKNAFS